MGRRTSGTSTGLQGLMGMAFVSMVVFARVMFWSPTQERVSPQRGCSDVADNCGVRVARGECAAHPKAMGRECRRACGLCGEGPGGKSSCRDVHDTPTCVLWQQRGECAHNAEWMMGSCARTCGFCVRCVAVHSRSLTEKLSLHDAARNDQRVWSSTAHELALSDDGVWEVTERSTGYAVLRQAAHTPIPFDADASWMVRPEGAADWHVDHSAFVDEFDCARVLAGRPTYTIPAQVRDDRKVPQAGVEYEADYDIHNLRPPTPDYGYPADGSARFLYPEDNPHMPPIPYYVMSYIPRVYYFPRFMSDEETDNIIAEAQERIERSSVIPHGNDSTIQDVRTSHGCWLGNSHKSVEAVRRRILAVTGFQPHQTEKLQVLRYTVGGKYESHLDYFEPDPGPDQASQWKKHWDHNWNRAATFYLNLHTTEEGGETALPRANGGPKPLSMRDCTKGLRVRPVKGAAILFYDTKPDGSGDPYSLHAGCPVKRGVKWGAPQWLHVKVRDAGPDDDFW